MNMENAISVKMENNLLTVDYSNLDGKLFCERVLNRVDWADNLGKGKYRIASDDKFYRLLSKIDEFNATGDVLFARGRLLSDSNLF